MSCWFALASAWVFRNADLLCVVRRLFLCLEKQYSSAICRSCMGGIADEDEI